MGVSDLGKQSRDQESHEWCLSQNYGLPHKGLSNGRFTALCPSSTKVNKCETNGMNPYQLIIYVRGPCAKSVMARAPGTGLLLHNVSD